MITAQLVLACLMFSNSPSMVKKCQEFVAKDCKNSQTIDSCYLKVAPKVNMMIKKQFAKAMILQ